MPVVCSASLIDYDYPMDDKSMRQHISQLAPFALEDNHPETLRVLSHFLTIREISKDWVIQRLLSLSSCRESRHRFLATTVLCSPSMPIEYQSRGRINMLKMAWEYGSKDQYESADYLLTYGNWFEKWYGQQSLCWILSSNSPCGEEAALSLWINGSRFIKENLRPFMRRYAFSEEIGSGRFLEALYYHGDYSDVAYIKFLMQPCDFIDLMEVEQ